MNQSLPKLLKSVVPLFQGFSTSEINTVISICKMRDFGEGEILIESGSESNDMMLILSGALLVKTARDVPLAQLFCPETIGEMGILTGARRSATVEGVEPGRVAVMTRDDLMKVLESQEEMALRFYKNVVDVLSVRLKNENFLIQMLREEVGELEDRLNLVEGVLPTDEQEDGTAIDEDDIVAAFYKRVGNPDLSARQRERDLTAYEGLRRTGYSDAQIKKTAFWAAQNVRGVKAFALVKHCIQEALKGE
jgi:CRP/FNR family cyclic AMP-dependent transcriptional regulator